MRAARECRKSVVVALFLSMVLIAFSAQATSPKEIIVFGESTSDVGNFFIIVGSPANDPWFTDGRIGNGPQWVDYLASYYKHVPELQPSFAGGTGYATAGADSS